MIIMALNCGSSSVKYQLFDWDKKEHSSNSITLGKDILENLDLIIEKISQNIKIV